MNLLQKVTYGIYFLWRLGNFFSKCQQVLGHAIVHWRLELLTHNHLTHADPMMSDWATTSMFDRKWKVSARIPEPCEFLNGCKHYGNQSRGYLMGGRPLWRPTVPHLAARSSQSNPRGSGPEVLKLERGHVPPNLEFRRWGSSGPSNLMNSLLISISDWNAWLADVYCH